MTPGKRLSNFGHIFGTWKTILGFFFVLKIMAKFTSYRSFFIKHKPPTWNEEEHIIKILNI